MEKIMENSIVKNFIDTQKVYNPTIAEISEIFIKEIGKRSYTNAVVSAMKAEAFVSAVNQRPSTVKLPDDQDVVSLLFTLLMSEYAWQKIDHPSVIYNEIYKAVREHHAPKSYVNPFSDLRSENFLKPLYETYTNYYVNAMNIIFDCYRGLIDGAWSKNPDGMSIGLIRSFFREFSMVWFYEWTNKNIDNLKILDYAADMIRSNLMEISGTTNLKESLIGYVEDRKREHYQMVPMSDLYKVAKGQITLPYIRKYHSDYFGNYEGLRVMDEKFIASFADALQI